MATRIAADFSCYVSLAEETPRVFVDCGFKWFSFWFLDIDDLRETLESAIAYDGLPVRAAEIAYSRARVAMGSYLEDEAMPYVPPVPTVRPKFHSLPHTLKAMVWLVYIVFTVECVAWCVRALWRGIN